MEADTLHILRVMGKLNYLQQHTIYVPQLYERLQGYFESQTLTMALRFHFVTLKIPLLVSETN